VSAQVDAGDGAEPDSSILAVTRDLKRREPSSLDELAPPDRILRDIIRSVQTGKVRMTMVRVADATIKRIPVSAREAQELELRVTEEEVAPAIAWSRTQGGEGGMLTLVFANRRNSRLAGAIEEDSCRNRRDLEASQRDLDTGATADQDRSAGALPGGGSKRLPRSIQEGLV
jgi:hypothetical protein